MTDLTLPDSQYWPPSAPTGAATVSGSPSGGAPNLVGISTQKSSRFFFDSPHNHSSPEKTVLLHQRVGLSPDGDGGSTI